MSRKRRAAKHLLLYGSSTFIRRIVGFLMLPIYTRYLTPEDYGIVALLSIMLVAFEVLFGARFLQAVPKFYYDNTDSDWRHSVVSTALQLTSGVSLVGVFGIYFTSTYISQALFDTPEHARLVAIYGVMFLTMAVEYYGYAFIRLLEKPFLYLSTSILRVVLQLIANIYFIVYRDMGVAGVVAGAVTSSLLFFIIMGIYMLRHIGFHFDKRMAKKLIAFSWPLWVSGLAILYISASNRYFIRLFSDMASVGLFQLASQFGSLIHGLVWMPFSQWWQTERFRLYKQEDHSREIFATVFNLISALMVFVCVSVAIIASPIIKIMASPDFHSAASAVPFLAFACMLSNLSGFFAFSLLVSENTRVIAYTNIFTAVTVTFLYLLLIPRASFLGASYAVLISSLFVFVINYLWSCRVANLGVSILPFCVNSFLGAVTVLVWYKWTADYSWGASVITAFVVTGIFASLVLTILYLSPHTRSVLQSGFSFLSRARRSIAPLTRK